MPFAKPIDTLPQQDPRTLQWAIAGNKTFVATLLAGYVYVVKYGGPRFMSGRRPYENLKPVILLYNLVMVFFNMYFFKNYLTRTYIGGGYDIVCQGINFKTNDKLSKEFLELSWWYFWVRVGDFLDTMFFVLRKKDSHVSSLHVIHHVLVVFNGWYGLTFGADGQAALGITINCFVHVVMYSYYFFSLLGPAVQPYLWWKRYLTQLQLVQFVIMIVHHMIPFFVNCGYPRTHSMLAVGQLAFIFVMFVRFYLKTYSKRQISPELNSSKHKGN